MEVYVARQPIFDRAMDIAGYELLYRRSMNNFYEGTDDNQATADVINNTFLVMQLRDLTGGTKAFINLSADLLMKEVPLMLPRKSIVMEVLECVEATDEVLAALKKLKDYGYTIALDDYAFHEKTIPMLQYADIVKVEFGAVDEEVQRSFLCRYKDRIRFLAEKVETREEYQAAIALGTIISKAIFSASL